MTLEPSIQFAEKDLLVASKGMEAQPFPRELEPILFRWIRPGGIGGQG